MGITIKLAGQDITPYSQEESIAIKITLGQSQGMTAGASGRAATCQFLTSLGPAAAAVGAGSVITSPCLVRGGELQIWDATNTLIFGGYAGSIEDKTEKTRYYTQINAYDYWQHLDRIEVQQVYSGRSDVYILRDLLTRYAPWIDQSALPSFGGYTFTVMNLKAITLQKAIGKITDVTGYQVWVTPDKKIHYVYPTQGQSIPFMLSNQPNFVTSQPCGVDDITIDDTATINRVTFYGGKVPSNDFTQDLSTQCNGSNKTFVLAYYPRVAADGNIHVNINSGADLVLGYLLGTGTQNKFKSAGGLCDVLLNADGHTLNFDVAPSVGVTLTCRYRYEFPLIVQLRDQVSYNYYGQWFDSTISDDTVFDNMTAVTRCRTVLAENSMGNTTLKIHCYKSGILPGQILPVYHSIRGLSTTFMVQEVDINPLGAGNFRYDITCGDWRWNFMDLVLATAQSTQKALTSATSPTSSADNGQAQTSVDVTQNGQSHNISSSTNTISYTPGGFYSRSTPSGDGHDAYVGLSTIAN